MEDLWKKEFLSGLHESIIEMDQGGGHSWEDVQKDIESTPVEP